MALIGALLLSPTQAWPLIADLIRPEHIARDDHRLVFETVAELIDSPGARPDVHVIVDHLEQTGRLDAAGGRDYLAGLIVDTASHTNARSYAIAVRNACERTKWLDVSHEIARAARDETPDTAAEIAARALEEWGVSTTDLRPAQSLELEAVSAWAEHAAPPPRDWVVGGLIPAGRVTSLFGNGGLGKTLLAMQLGLHISLNRPLFELEIAGGPVLGIFCEDEQDELERRGRAACEGERVDLAAVDGFYPMSRDGLDSVICTFEHDKIQLTRFYHELDATIAGLGPRLVILDTAADLFAGDFLSTPHVRQFIKIALGGLCVRHGCAILLLAHPSQSAMSSGDGGGFSTAWNNSVRSRLYLRRPKTGDVDETADRRVLEVMKANYASGGLKLPLAYQEGYFVPDPEPIDEANARARPEGASKLAFAVHTFMRDRTGGGVVAFREIYDHVLEAGEIDRTEKPATARKKVQRSLDQLIRMELVKRCEIPRGTYRLRDDRGRLEGVT